jgi:hypothetical protein
MNSDRRSAAVARGRLRERLATLKAICAITEPDTSSFQRALDAVLALDERHQDELADVMFAATAEAGRRWTAWRFRCEEPDCPVGVVTYSQEWEPDAGLSVCCPVCGSGLGRLAIVDAVGGGLAVEADGRL